MKKYLLFALLAVPLAALAGFDYIELTATDITTADVPYTVSTTLPQDGRVCAVHIEQTSSGTPTNSVVIDTTTDRGISFTNNTVLALTSNTDARAVFYPRQDIHDTAGAAVDLTNGVLEAYILIQDILRMSVTSVMADTTNTITTRIVIEN